MIGLGKVDHFQTFLPTLNEQLLSIWPKIVHCLMNHFINPE